MCPEIQGWKSAVDKTEDIAQYNENRSVRVEVNADWDCILQALARLACSDVEFPMPEVQLSTAKQNMYAFWNENRFTSVVFMIAF